MLFIMVKQAYISNVLSVSTVGELSYGNKEFVNSLPKDKIAFKDLKRTIVLINNALPDMFYYLKEPIIPATTNMLESFYSRLKADYRRHRGLSQKHKIQYLKWYCFLKNNNIS